MARLFSIGQAARYLGVARSTLKVWVGQRRIKPQRTAGGHMRFLVQDLDVLQNGGHPRSNSGENVAPARSQGPPRAVETFSQEVWEIKERTAVAHALTDEEGAKQGLQEKREAPVRAQDRQGELFEYGAALAKQALQIERRVWNEGLSLSSWPLGDEGWNKFNQVYVSVQRVLRERVRLDWDEERVVALVEQELNRLGITDFEFVPVGGRLVELTETD